MVDLKNDNINIDLTNNILTLENIFQVNLHQYNDIIQNILQTAIKELQIEKNLNDIQQQRDTMLFQFFL
ncbi:unnamed protein product, partial [Rotaria sp. Silwood2]